jgi:hypothetical protein
MAAAKKLAGSELASCVNTCFALESWSVNDSIALVISAAKLIKASGLFMGPNRLSTLKADFTAKL